ncbi:type IV secretion system protein VirB10 [Gilvimarinus chinensis]|uniref:type IV secretion system protein VirB10 n=1 Tax=Gilvimarinus chinensis TaxID=396005 RepID=UPI0003756635|nr:type IV secretion system protein VirB10 [Gilvimarinus chinensis]
MADRDDNNIEQEEIPSVGDDTGKSKNVTFWVVMIVLVVGASLLLIIGASGDDEDAKKDKLDAWVEEDFDPANRQLRLPSERRYERKEPQQTTRPTFQVEQPRVPEQRYQAAPPGLTEQESREDANERKRREQMWEKRRSAPPVVFGGGGSGNKSAQGEAGTRRQNGRSVDYDGLADKLMSNVTGGKSGAGRRDKDLMAERLSASETESVTASFIKDKPHTIAQGKVLGCILETAMNSELPGMTRCVLTEDVYSYDGRQRLLEKGSRLVGQYEGGIQHGESRIFVIWTRVITPGGVDVALDSPGIGALGRAGHSAYIDSHFLERFGASSLLSIIGSLAATESDGDVRVEGIADSFNESAEIALKESIRIRPTGHKNQGERIKVFVARDIDFGPVLRLARDWVKR